MNTLITVPALQFELYFIINTLSIMKRIKFGTGFAVFVLFFGIAMLEAFRTRNILSVVFWIIMAVAFLWMDNRKTNEQ